MPLYPYRCTQCGHRFEKIQKFGAEPERECPKCHGPLERPLTAPRLHFKGAGWYVNDYASKTGPSTSESNSASDQSPASAPAEAKTPSAPKESATASPSASAAPPPASASS